MPFVLACFPADLLQAEKSSQCQELLVYQARSWELLLPSYKQVFPELHPRNLLNIFIKPRLLMPIVVLTVSAPRQALVVFECPAPTVVLGDILYLMSAVTFAALICFVINFVMKMNIQSKVKSLQGGRLASITEVHHFQEKTSACPSIASTDRQESDALVTTEVNVQPSSSVKSIVTASSTGLKELRPFDLRASWDTQSLERLAACASRQGRQVTLHPSLGESLTRLMRPLSLELEQMEPPSSAKRPVLVTMHGRHAIFRRCVKLHLMDYCATKPDNMSTLLSSVSQASHDEHEWMVAEISEHLKANTVSVTTLQLGLEGIGMGFMDTTARPLSVSVFGCLEGEAQVETKQDQAYIMAIEEMFKPSSRVKQMVTELLSGFKKPYLPHIFGSLKTRSVEGRRLASITEVHHFQEKTSACPSIASTDRQESDALVTTEVNVQSSSSVKSIVTASSTGLKELRPFDLRASWDTQSLESLAACASRQGRQVTLHPSLAEFLNTLMRPLSLELEQIEPPSSAKRPVLVTMHGRHAIIRRCVKVHLMDYCATKPDNMSTLLSSVSQASHDEHEWMVVEISEHLKANTVSVTTLQLGLEGIGMGFMDTTARPLSVSVFGCLEGEAQVETKQDQAYIMAIEEMFKPSSRVKQMVTELLSGFKKPYLPHIFGSLKTRSVEGARLASITEVHQFQERAGACPSIASTDRQESDALVTTEVNVQPSSSVKSIVTASSTGLKELRPFDLRASWDTQSLERLAACASRQGRQVTLHPSLGESLTRLMRPLSLELEQMEPPSSAKRPVLVTMHGRHAIIRRRVKVHLMDYCGTEPDNKSTLLSSVSQVSHDEHEWMVAEMSEHLKANKLNVSTLQLNLERLGMGLMDMAVRFLLEPGFGSGKEEARKEESEETKQYQACFISTEEMFSPVRQMVIDLPSDRMKPYFPGIRGSRKTHLIYDCATAPEHMAALPSSAIQLSRNDHQCVVEKSSDSLDVTPATDLARADACFPAIAVPNPVSVPKSASFGEERQGENPDLKHHECCEEEPQYPMTETLPKGNADGVTTLGTDFAGDLPDTPFPAPVYESKSSSLGEESKGEDTALEQHECCVKEPKSLMSETLPEDITDGLSIQYNQYLKKDEESSSVEEPRLVIGVEKDRVSKNDNDANLATVAGVVHTPNEGVDRELPSDRTTPMSTNDGDTSKENQQLLHKCTQAQKKKAKRKNQRPKISQRKSRTGKQECQKKENEPELSVIGKESILHNFRTEAIVEQDVVSAKQYPMTESSDARSDKISHQAEDRTPHKTPTASELAASITDAQEGKVKGSNKLNVRTKQSKSKNTDAEAELLSVQGVKINLRESKNQNRKESKKRKHRNNHVDDYPRKGHACGVMGRPSTPSTTKRSSYATATQKGNSTGRENHKESYQMNGMVQDGARSNNSLDLRDGKSSSRLLVKANMHQGDARLIIPGVQCCSIALCAILRASGKSPLLWTPEDMDDIILTGDRKHRETQEKMNRPKTAFLHIDEIELDIKLRGRHFHLKRSDVMCGDIMNDGTDKSSPLPGIESSIETLSEYDMFIVRYLLYTIALFKTSQTWLLFDSHNRDQNGFRHPDGKAVLLEFKTLRSVACYIRRFVSSNGFSDETSPRPLDDSQLSYELAGIKVSVLS
ncbi:uncharacterized protein LOC116617480 [Nematostella vectensis]|uniref:uncharacterized protein LOC116617480 n=1 Tax=Nematostella vectensis TaxID=45351 RepID=UPI0020771DF1|nr:uncharacterized protein LOC116617480 [Nematostella vectensis]